jgi:hypothetical protein
MKNSRNTWKLSFAVEEPPLPHVFERRFSVSPVKPFKNLTVAGIILPFKNLTLVTVLGCVIFPG